MTNTEIVGNLATPPKEREKKAPPPSAPRTRKLLICSCKGGSGKTTTALNLATLAAEDGQRVLVVDLDSQQTLSWWVGARPAAAARIDLLSTRLSTLNRGGMAMLEKRIADTAPDLVIIDSPPSMDDWPSETQRLIHFADLTLIPTGQGTPDLRSVTEWMLALRREGASAAFLINQSDRAQRSFEQARKQLNVAGLLCSFDVRRLSDIRAVYDMGIGANECTGSNAMGEFQPVWAFVRNLLEGKRR